MTALTQIQRNSIDMFQLTQRELTLSALRRYKYTVVFEPKEDGHNVSVPAIPETCTFGETLEGVWAMAEDAIHCYLESAIKNGEPIPEHSEPTSNRVTHIHVAGSSGSQRQRMPAASRKSRVLYATKHAATLAFSTEASQYFGSLFLSTTKIFVPQKHPPASRQAGLSVDELLNFLVNL